MIDGCLISGNVGHAHIYIYRIHLDRVSSSISDSFQQFTVVSLQKAILFRWFMRVFGTMSDAVAQAVFDGYWPL